MLSTAITILLWHVQGKAFREVVALRFGYLTRDQEQRQLRRQLREEDISYEEYEETFKGLKIQYSAIPHQLPKASLVRSPSRFKKEHISKLNFDLLVYDTYDYLDKVISFSLSDIFVAAYMEYYKETKDERSLAMVNYIKYGTNDSVEIWLLRYGFSFEDIELIKEKVVEIDENSIQFDSSIQSLAGEPVMELVERYLIPNS